jgi:hypothetical protein
MGWITYWLPLGYRCCSPFQMIDIDFTITYPCFIPMLNESDPFTITADGDIAVVVCTDDDALNAFFDMATSGVRRLRLSITNRTSLISILKEGDGSANLAGNTITHLAIDPMASRRVRCHKISQFVHHLEFSE